MITVNRLLGMLLAEVNSFNFGSYQQLLLRKAQITREIKKKRTTQAVIEELHGIVLPKQIETVSYYTERLPRIERIIEILRIGKGRIVKPAPAELGKIKSVVEKFGKSK